MRTEENEERMRENYGENDRRIKGKLGPGERMRGRMMARMAKMAKMRARMRASMARMARIARRATMRA